MKKAGLLAGIVFSLLLGCFIVLRLHGTNELYKMKSYHDSNSMRKISELMITSKTFDLYQIYKEDYFLRPYLFLSRFHSVATYPLATRQISDSLQTEKFLTRNVFIEISGFSTEYMKNTKQVILFNKYNSHMKIYFFWNLNNGKKPYILKTEGLLE